jgi:hypothetical protein
LSAIFPAIRAALAAMLLPVAASVNAHEFWIEPAEYAIGENATVVADLRIGQDFQGDRLPYLPTRFERFRIDDAAGVMPVAGRTGAMPAVEAPVRAPGPQIITYVSRPDRLQFSRRETFEAYLRYEGLEHVLALHEERGLPETGFTEIYIRCAKALVAAGQAAPSDRATGMPFELVALDNPQDLGGRTVLRVRVLWQGAGSKDVRINLFRKNGPSPAARVRSSADGIAEIPLDGPGPYLLNAVHMEAAPPQSGAAWLSHWASLTFAVPSPGTGAGRP